jgi:hypothetical protein
MWGRIGWRTRVGWRSRADRPRVAEAAWAGLEARVPGIDAALHSHEVATPDLVAQRVGETLHRMVAGHAIAVEVQQRVQVGQAESTVAAEDGDASGAQVAPGDELVLVR